MGAWKKGVGLSRFRMDDASIAQYARAVDVPTLLVQLHHDLLTKAEDIESLDEASPDEDGGLPGVVDRQTG